MVFASSKYWVPKPVTDVVAVKDLNNENLIALEYATPVFIVNSGAMIILFPSYSLVKWW